MHPYLLTWFFTVNTHWDLCILIHVDLIHFNAEYFLTTGIKQMPGSPHWDQLGSFHCFTSTNTVGPYPRHLWASSSTNTWKWHRWVILGAHFQLTYVTNSCPKQLYQPALPRARRNQVPSFPIPHRYLLDLTLANLMTMKWPLTVVLHISWVNRKTSFHTGL